MHCLVLHYITMHHTMVIASCIVFVYAICRSHRTLYDIMLYNDSSHVTVYLMLRYILQEHKPGISCLACKEARRQKRIQRQAQLTQDGSTPQGEASPPEGVTDAKAGKAKGPDGQHSGSSMAVVTEDGQISSVAAEGPAWVPVELDFGGKPTSPFSKAAAQQHLKLGSGVALHVVCAFHCQGL